jgi:hypothetical protein
MTKNHLFDNAGLEKFESKQFTYVHTYTFKHTQRRCNWRVQTNFGHKFHIPKQEKMSILTCVQEHLIFSRSWKNTFVDLFSCSVWMCGQGLLVIFLSGLHVLSHQYAGSHYWDLLIDDLPKLLEDVLAVRAWMWHMYEGAVAHFSCAVWDVLYNTCHDHWIGRGGPTAWPLLLPDLNPLNFCVWRYIETLVYAASVDSEEAFHHDIVDTCQTINKYPGIFEWLWLPMMMCRGARWFSWRTFDHL